MMITITLNQKEADALVTIAHRYYFDLFKPIRLTEEEEFRFRDAILAVAEKIHNQHKEKKQ